MAVATLQPSAVAAGGTRLRDLGMPFRLALAAVVLIGFGLRAWGATHPEAAPGPDADAYATLAKALYLHHTYGPPGFSHTSDWSAGAPLFFGAVYWLTGGVHPEAARIAVALLGAGMVLCTFLIGVRLANRWVGLLAALLVATYPTYIENNAQLLSEPVAAALLTATVLAILWAADERAAAARWIIPGLALGALILTRPEYEAIGAVLAVLVAWRLWRSAGWRRAVAAVAVLAACAALVVVPWMWRNHRVVGQWTVSTGGGKALFVATFLPGGGRQIPTKAVLLQRFHIAKHGRHLKQIPMAPLLDRVARKYPSLSRDKALGRIGRENLVKYLRERPFAYVRMTATKFWIMFNRGSSPYMRNRGWIAYHRALLLAGIAGFVLLAWRRRTRWAALIVGAPIACIAVLGSILLAVPRRQVPIMPLICLFAAVAAWTAAQALRGRLLGRHGT